MTHTLPTTSGPQLNRAQRTLIDAVSDHSAREVASFHMPGHKGRTTQSLFLTLPNDVTELPGLDDLTYPSGVLADLEQRGARIWQAGQSIISINGASAGILSALLACVRSGKSKLLLPRNAHRSAVHALVLSGLEPVWYEPTWDETFGLWSNVDARSFAQAIADHKNELAGALVVSPTYTGALSDISELTALAHEAGVPLVVDQAQGAHLPLHAVACGADVTIHSLHKTLPGLTQTALIHVAGNSLIDAQCVRDMLRLVQTSSPSYLLLCSIDAALSFVESSSLQSIHETFRQLKQQLSAALAANPLITVQPLTDDADAAHVLVSHKEMSAPRLYDALQAAGIGAEAVFGQSVLLLLGTGSTTDDITALVAALENLAAAKPIEETQPAARPHFAEQAMNPRAAYLSPVELVEIGSADGRIAAECLAPCPPGTPTVVPGQRISLNDKEILSKFSISGKTHIRVVVES